MERNHILKINGDMIEKYSNLHAKLYLQTFLNFHVYKKLHYVYRREDLILFKCI